ncbi:MAG TPA: hypothetical protein VJB13_00660 [Candidatus Nanoarchaeia archaeon]|nr:hypothetical protein [Candidatus Nanoarchaeia archaeon]
MKNRLIPLIFLLLLLPLASAATLKGSIYNENLQLSKDVLVEINTVPQQKYLAKTGLYSFDLPPGKYTLTAKSSQYTVTENVEILSATGEYVLDLFLLPDFVEEDQLWQETQQEIPLSTEESAVPIWSWIIAGVIFVVLLARIIYTRKKYGSLRLFQKKVKAESRKTLEQHKEELAAEPGYLDQALEIIKKHDGRINQKELRREMMPLSEAKVSLIITELEHKGKVEKIKKGRGNVVILKS